MMNELRSIRAKSGTNQEGAGAHNKRVIIDALRLNGPLSRADLARATRLTKQTVSNLMEALEIDGLVTSDEAVRKGRGQPSTPYRLVPAGAFAIGLQIDRHLTRAIAVDLVGNPLVRLQAALPANGPEGGVRIILDLIAKARQALSAIMPQSEARMAGLGVAMPGPFGLEATGSDQWMMAEWQSFPLIETLATGTGLAVERQNDAAACATAERMLGAARGMDHAACLYLGYGIGAGLILGGSLYAGAHGNAGEIGMALMAPDGDVGTPLEHRASLASLYEHLGLDPSDERVNQIVSDLVDARDGALLAWVSHAARDLRWAIHLLETLFDPQAVILCGGAPRQLASLLIEKIEPLLPSNSRRKDRRTPRLLLGMFDPWAVALGAAVEPIGRAFEPRFAAILKE